MEPTFRSPFSYGISNSGKRLPRNGLLLYLARPNSDEYLIGEDTEIGEDTYIWGYILPNDADIRAATGWVSGTANVFYTATGVPIVALATEIAAAIDHLPLEVVFSLVNATTQTGRLAIYAPGTSDTVLARAYAVLRYELALPSSGLLLHAGTAPETIGATTVLRSTLPAGANPTVPQVKGSGFAGAGSATVTGLLTTDTITAIGNAPTCSVDGTLTFPGPDCWDVYVHRGGKLWAYWPGVNVGQNMELDASGNSHHLTKLTATTITERVDGSGTGYSNEAGFSVRENLLDSYPTGAIGFSIALVGGYLELVKTTSATSSSVPFDSLEMTQNVAKTSAYTARCTLRKLSNTSNSKVDLGFYGSGWSGHSAKIISGPGSVAISFWASVSGLSDSEDTIVEVIKSDFVPGATPTKFSVYAGSIGDSTIGNGCKVKEVYLCEGAATNSTYGPPMTQRGIAVRSIKGGYPQSLGTIICIGDSLTAGYIPEIQKLHPLSTFVNKGVGGNTPAQILARFAADTATGDFCILFGGINAVIAGVPAASMMADIAACVDIATAAGMPVVLSELSPFGLNEYWTVARQQTLEDFNGLLQVYGTSNGIPVVGLYDAMRDGTTDNLLAKYAAADGLHFSASGYATQALFFADALPVVYNVSTDVRGHSLQNIGPLRADLTVTAGTSYPDLTVTAPLGPEFQGITEWAGGAAVDLSTLAPTANTRTGQLGVAVWNPGLDAAEILRADRVIGA